MTEQSKGDKNPPKILDDWLKESGFIENKNPEPRAWVIFPGHPLGEKLRELHRAKYAGNVLSKNSVTKS